MPHSPADRLLRSAHRNTLALLAAGFCALLVSSSSATVPERGEVPEDLESTGLYADFATKSLAPGVFAYSPQYPLWTDGAIKRRWISLPAGTTIDASDPDAWVFPVGTRIWKEFSFARRIETRFMERAESGAWVYATYRWNQEETQALLVSGRGVKRAAESRPGVPYSIPSVVDCRACHESGATSVLAFSALQLSSDRDPLAPHATPPEPGSLDLAELVRRGLVVGLPAALVATPPRVPAATPTARAALGYLHGNCAHCHNAASPIAKLGLFLTVKVDGTCAALTTAVAHESKYRPTGTTIDERIVPGAPDASLLIARVASRDPARQMPPLGTHLVDEEALALLSRWIAEDIAPPPVAAGETTVTSLAPSSEITQENAP